MWMLFEEFSVSAFSSNHGLYISHDILFLIVIHHCLTRWILAQLVSVNLYTWHDVIRIANNNSLIIFGKKILVIDTSSYTCPCLTIWGSDTTGIITTQIKIILLHQNVHVVNKKFPDITKFLTMIIPLISPFLICIIVANLPNTFNLYPG